MNRRTFLLARFRSPKARPPYGSAVPGEEVDACGGRTRPSDIVGAARPSMVAQVQPFACLANHSQVCTVCVERCPEAGAITLQNARPVVDGALCTGCGECERRCPGPGGGIRLFPRASRSPDESAHG